MRVFVCIDVRCLRKSGVGSGSALCYPTPGYEVGESGAHELVTQCVRLCYGGLLQVGNYLFPRVLCWEQGRQGDDAIKYTKYL